MESPCVLQWQDELKWKARAPHPKSPLQCEDNLNLSSHDIWTANICAITVSVWMQLLFGAICDKYRARVPMGCALMVASIPTACTGLLNSLTGCKWFDNVNIWHCNEFLCLYSCLLIPSTYNIMMHATVSLYRSYRVYVCPVPMWDHSMFTKGDCWRSMSAPIMCVFLHALLYNTRNCTEQYKLDHPPSNPFLLLQANRLIGGCAMLEVAPRI